jgi:hypothetical protein
MSLLPSSPAVSERLTFLREERAVAKAAFRSAVEAASIGWEAELLLALEEFRDAGGFVSIQDQIRAEIQREAMMRRERRDLVVLGSESRHLPPLSDLFLAEIMDLTLAIQAARSDAVPRYKGDPTMETERAALRNRLLVAIRTELRDAIQADMDAQGARDRAIVEQANRVAQEEMQARQRLMGSGVSRHHSYLVKTERTDF